MKKAKKKPSYARETRQYMLGHVRRYWKSTFLICTGILIAVASAMVIPYFYKLFIDELTSGDPSRQELFSILGLIAAGHGISWLTWRFVDPLINWWQPRIMKDIIDDCYGYLQKHSYQFFTNNFSGSLVKKLYRTADGFETVSDNIIFQLYPIVIRVAASMWLLGIIIPLLTVILFVWLIVFIFFNYRFTVYKLRFDEQVNEVETRLSGFAADTITNSYNVMLFGAHHREKRRLERLTSEWKDKTTFRWNISAIGFAVQGLLMLMLELSFIYMGITLWEQGLFSVGDFVLIQGILVVLFGKIWEFGRVITNMSRGFSLAQEMVEVLETPHEIIDAPGAKQLRISRGAIEVRDLTFGYTDNAPVFRNFNLSIAPKQKVALVSRSGSGKSTLIKLFMRLYNVPNGTVFIDGQDIMQVTQDSLRAAISFVPQEPVLFHRSLADNISYGRPKASMHDIIEASKLAHCHEFISKLPDGYKTYVGERGVKLSGGERQRVAIARAVLENNPILILDEATSSLDSESEQYIQDALDHLMKDKTTIVIAHRLSTISQMDEIIVIEHGQITERGTHAALLKNEEGHYKKLWEIQAGGFS
ncbi:MAG: ABC transporter ATP-binding protein [Patescibacteria group bacterium]